MSHPLPRGWGRSRDDLSPPACHCTPRHPASSSWVEGAPAGSAMDYLRQPSTCPPASPHAAVDGRSARQVGSATAAPVTHPPHRLPHTGVEGRSAGVEEWQQQPSHHIASIASPPCLVPYLPASSYSGADSGLIRTAGPAADFLALYDCCRANGLKARLKFNHQAAHQEIVISYCLPQTSSPTNTDCRRHRRRRCRRRRRPAASQTGRLSSLVTIVPAPSSAQEPSPLSYPTQDPPLLQHHRRSPHQ
jgi:hypothetical protein